MKKSNIVLLPLVSMIGILAINGCGLTNSTLSSELFQQEFKPGRFAFVYEPGPDATRKEKTLAEIDKFWHDFRANKEKLAWSRDPNADLSFGINFLSERLHAFDRRLEWECGLAKDGVSELDFSVAEDIELLPLLYTIVERAGHIPGWRIGCFRQRLDSAMIAEAYKARAKEPLPPYRACVSRNKQNQIEVKLISSHFAADDSPTDLSAAFLLTGLVVGEENSEKWVTYVHTANDKSVDSKTFNSEREASKFAHDFDALKQTLVDSLPAKPRWQINYPDRVYMATADKEAVVKNSSKARQRFSFICLENDLLERLVDSYRFWSEQSSRTGEKFAYLHILSRSGDKMEDRRTALEDSLTKLLREKKLGCVVATGRGKPDSFYFDLCLTDVDKAVPVLKQFCVSNNLPPETWLRFYDTYLRHEWVKMMPATPDLKDPESIW